MVYFKVNNLLARVIKAAGLWQKSDMGCSKNCDQQLITLEQIEICLDNIRKKIEELEKCLQQQKEVREAREEQSKQNEDEAAKGKEDLQKAMLRMQQQAKLLTIEELPADKIR